MSFGILKATDVSTITDSDTVAVFVEIELRFTNRRISFQSCCVKSFISLSGLYGYLACVIGIWAAERTAKEAHHSNIVGNIITQKPVDAIQLVEMVNTMGPSWGQSAQGYKNTISRPDYCSAS